MQSFSKYIKQAQASGVDHVRVIDPAAVVVANWVRMKCQFGCGGYGKRLTCPPFSPTPEYTQALLREYEKALLLQIENIAPQDESQIHDQFKRLVPGLERELFLDGYYKALALTTGPCYFCNHCQPEKPCEYPHLARPAMEACGIDVYQTVRNCGMQIQVVRSRESCCTYVSLILIH